MLRGYVLTGLLLALSQSGAAQRPAPAAPDPPAQATSSVPSPQVPTPAAPCVVSPPGHNLHCITVTFDYDFNKTKACVPKHLKQPCVQQFVVYDISAGLKKRRKLFVVPLPDLAKGHVAGVTFTSPPLDFESGPHILAVVAQDFIGTDSRPRNACTTQITVP
jgi:hypothetical protein